MSDLELTDLPGLTATVNDHGKRLDEIEARLAEAGRRAIFPTEGIPTTAAQHSPINAATLAHVGRAMLFDTETPDDQPSS